MAEINEVNSIAEQLNIALSQCGKPWYDPERIEIIQKHLDKYHQQKLGENTLLPPEGSLEELEPLVKKIRDRELPNTK